MTEDLQIANDFNYVTSWLTKNETIFCNYTFHIISAFMILVIGAFVSKTMSEGVNGILIHRKIDETISGFLSTLSKYVILAVAFIASLDFIGVRTTSVLALIGAAGMAVGIGLQGSLSNFAAGIILVALRPLKTGEYVDLGGVSGTVLYVHIFYTTLRTLDGKIVVAPNSKIINGTIINYSREPARRNEFFIRVAYNTDIEFITKILKEVIMNEERVLKDRAITVGISEFGPNSMHIMVRCWSRIDDLNLVYWDLMKKFKKTLDENKVHFPSSLLDLFIEKNKEKLLKQINNVN